MKDNNTPMTANRKGFTLVELILGITIASVVTGAAYTLFITQQNTYTAQQGVVDMQQDLRAGLYYLTREIRLAGLNHQNSSYPNLSPGLNPGGIVEAGPGMVHFTMDIYDQVDDDGDSIVDNDVDEIGLNDNQIASAGEDIIYALMDDGDLDGLPDTLTSDSTPVPNVLERHNMLPAGSSRVDPLVENVEAIAFAYAYDYDGDGKLDFLDSNGNGTQDGGEPTHWAIDTDNDQKLDTLLDTDQDGDIDSNDTAGGTAMLNPAGGVEVDRIRAIQLWLLLKSPKKDNKFISKGTYVVGDKHLSVDDNYRRRLLTTSVVCRNMAD